MERVKHTKISANGTSCVRRNSSDASHKRKKKWPRYFGNATHCNATQSKIVFPGNDFLQTHTHTDTHICVCLANAQWNKWARKERMKNQIKLLLIPVYLSKFRAQIWQMKQI